MDHIEKFKPTHMQTKALMGSPFRAIDGKKGVNGQIVTLHLNYTRGKCNDANGLIEKMDK